LQLKGNEIQRADRVADNFVNRLAARATLVRSLLRADDGVDVGGNKRRQRAFRLLRHEGIPLRPQTASHPRSPAGLRGTATASVRKLVQRLALVHDVDSEPKKYG